MTSQISYDYTNINDYTMIIWIHKDHMTGQISCDYRNSKWLHKYQMTTKHMTTQLATAKQPSFD